ncbi:unnamed protein product [Choristocarpus tenellus]
MYITFITLHSLHYIHHIHYIHYFDYIYCIHCIDYIDCIDCIHYIHHIHYIHYIHYIRSTFRLRDHHCVWVGQCVAQRNRRSFLSFLLLLCGLSFWFAYRLLKVDETSYIHAIMDTAITRNSSHTRSALDEEEEEEEEGHELENLKRWWRSRLMDLVFTNRGGPGVAHALYAIMAGTLAASLAFQQCILIGANLTSLELRRRTQAANRTAETQPGASSGASNGVMKGQACNAVASAAGTAPSSFIPTPAPSLLPTSLGMFVSNWGKFLTGTELCDWDRSNVCNRKYSYWGEGWCKELLCDRGDGEVRLGMGGPVAGPRPVGSDAPLGLVDSRPPLVRSAPSSLSRRSRSPNETLLL